MQEYLTEIVSKKALTLEVVEITVNLIAPSPLSFNAGQAMQLKLNNVWYDIPIAVPPQENNKTLAFCMRLIEGAPAYEFVQDLSVGNKIVLKGPVGNFTPGETQYDVLCIASNTGIAVFASIIPSLILNNFEKKIKLLFEVQSEEEMFYFARFSQLAGKHPNFTFTPIVIKPFSHWPGEIGTASTFVRVSGKMLIDSAVYISGRKKFVDDVMSEWRKIEPDKKDLYTNIIPETL